MAVAEYPPKEMMEETATCFDPNAVPEQAEGVAFSRTDGRHHQQNIAASAVEEVDLHRHHRQQELIGFAAEFAAFAKYLAGYSSRFRGVELLS